MASTITRSQQTNRDITSLLKARNTLLWIITREELRVERAIIEAAADAKFPTVFWDCVTGLTDATGTAIDAQLFDPTRLCEMARTNTTKRVYVLRDLHRWLADPQVCRSVRTTARMIQGTPLDEARTIIVLTPSADVPPELAGHTTVIDYPLPERPEIGTILDTVLSMLPEAIRENVAKNGTREAAIDAAVGLTSEEASNCYAKSLVTLKKIDVGQVASEKKRVIARERVITWTDAEPRGFKAVGGNAKLVAWADERRAALSQRARDFGLPAPKGVMLVGVPGCGKSLMAKAVAAAWNVPLLRLDLGALRSKYVGESEGNIRKALAVAETVAPCVLWIDEIEKALAGSTGPQGDGGVSADALGAVLNWLQEKQGSVFVVATANDVTGLPPELLRKGRFDELFFVDLPTRMERAEIIVASLKHYNREPLLDVDAVAVATEGFTGAEIAALVPDALFAAFADRERAITTQDLLRAAATVVPLSRTASEKITALRQWAKGRARPASDGKAPAVAQRGQISVD